MFSIFGWPFRALVSFLRGISEVIDWALQSLGGSSARPAWLTIVMLPILIPYWLGLTIYSVLSYPFSLSKLEPERLHNLYWGIPSLLALLVTLYAVLYTFASAGSIDDRYRLAMQRALAIGDFKLATVLGGRLVSDKVEADLQTRFSYAIALRQSGEAAKADAILGDLAPSDQPGYSPAHRMRAMYFAAQLQNGSNEKTLSQLRWHLENSGEEPNAAIEKLWVAYYVTVGQPELAVPHMENAAKLDPSSLVKLANLYAQTGNKPGENRSLRQAESQFIKRLKDNPLARDERQQLALAQVRLEKFAQAEETMLKGVELHNDVTMRRSAAEFYVMLFDVAGRNKKEDFEAQFAYLERALRQDLFYGDIYERLIKFYQKSEASKTSSISAQEYANHGDRTLQLLEKMLVDGKSPALVHFALSSIHEIRGNHDKSTFHLLASYRLDSNFPVVTNNYAWMLAHSQNPDLPRAYELSLTAVRASPNDPRFLDTYATILMKQGKHHDAIAVFEKIVTQSNDKISIHIKLAELYSTVGMKDFARKHQERAEELTRQEAEKAEKARKR